MNNTKKIVFLILFISLFCIYIINKSKHSVVQFNIKSYTSTIKEDTEQEKTITPSENTAEEKIIENTLLSKSSEEDTKNTIISKPAKEKNIENTVIAKQPEEKSADINEVKIISLKATEKLNKVTKTYNSIFEQNYFDENGHLNSYPNYGDKYATLKIEKLKINAPIYYGDNQNILLKGVGHFAGSYFAGEGGSIILCGHNYMNSFSKLGNLKNGDVIEIKTAYGDFYYRMYDSKVITDSEDDELKIQSNKEILMIYTCYPFNTKEYTKYRYVVFAEKI